MLETFKQLFIENNNIVDCIAITSDNLSRIYIGVLDTSQRLGIAKMHTLTKNFDCAVDFKVVTMSIFDKIKEAVNAQL